MRALPKQAEELILDLDSLGHLVHGWQEGRHFNAYDDGSCHQPLYVVCGAVVLWAPLRTGESDPKHAVLAALRQIMAAIREGCPGVRLMGRGESGFCREELRAFCESQVEVYDVLGLAKNVTLVKKLERHLFWAAAKRCLCGPEGNREFTGFADQTQESWSKERRVVAQAEVPAEGANPRLVVTSLPGEGFGGRKSRRPA